MDGKVIKIAVGVLVASVAKMIWIDYFVERLKGQ